jgi:hypothetical protein
MARESIAAIAQRHGAAEVAVKARFFHLNSLLLPKLQIFPLFNRCMYFEYQTPLLYAYLATLRNLNMYCGALSLFLLNHEVRIEGVLLDELPHIRLHAGHPAA